MCIDEQAQLSMHLGGYSKCSVAMHRALSLISICSRGHASVGSRKLIAPYMSTRYMSTQSTTTPQEPAPVATIQQRAKATVPTLVRGMHDVLPGECLQRRKIINEFFSLSESFGFSEIQTPLLEQTKLFARSLGDASDVVMKEMYSFTTPNGDDSLTLRPENTAGVMRALISSQLISTQQRLAYAGPMFRHERPQRGRYRQFFQLGLEHVGQASHMADIEIIACAEELLSRFIDSNKYKTTLHINSLGTVDTMARYGQALQTYFQQHLAALSPDSQGRLQRGAVLRILDSKDKSDREIIRDAPKIASFYDAESGSRFEAVLKGLNYLGIATEVDSSLVRGLDYYRHTIFEFIAKEIETTESGSSPVGTVLAGGRYDGLAAQLGGPKDVPAIGWAAGLERLLLLGKQESGIEAGPKIVVIPMCAKGAQQQLHDSETKALEIAGLLRARGHGCVTQPATSSLKKALSAAGKQGFTVALLIGEDELKCNSVTLRDMRVARQQSVPESSVADQVNETLRVSPLLGAEE